MPKRKVRLSKENLVAFALEAYENPFCVNTQEFHNDLGRPKQVQRFLTRYCRDESANLRVLINNAILFFNVFERAAANHIMFFQVKEKNHTHLKSLLVVLNLYRSNLGFDKIKEDKKLTADLRKELKYE